MHASHPANDGEPMRVLHSIVSPAHSPRNRALPPPAAPPAPSGSP